MIELDILDFLRVFGIFAISVICYKFIFHRNVEKRNGVYKKPDWNHFIKKWLAKRKLNQIKIDQKHKLMRKLTKDKSERPLVLKNESSSDSQKFYGSDQEGNSILIGMTRLRYRTAELWFILKLKNGDKWTLPCQPGTRVYEVTTGKFKAVGLEFECLQPFSRWRITYNGYLRKGQQNKFKRDIDQSLLTYIKFNFFFNACNEPLFWPIDWSSTLMADSIAMETWRDGNWANNLNIPGNGGYDQYGEIFGQIYFSDRDELLELNLPGIRQRRWEAFQNRNLRRSVLIYGVTRAGYVFNIGAQSYNKHVSQIQYGNIRFSNGETAGIDWTDFNLVDFGEHEDAMPKNYSIHFKAAGRIFKLFLNLQGQNTINFLQGRPFSSKTLATPIDFNFNSDTGFGLVVAWYPYSIPFNEVGPICPERFSKLVYNNSLPSYSKLTLTFEDVEAQSKIVSGGKGGSLALLTVASNQCDVNRKFQVPQGFIVSSSALKLLLLNSNEIYLELRNLEDICFGKINGDLKASCDKLENLFKTCILPQHIFELIKYSFHDLKTKKKNIESLRFIVRSSGIDEDGQEFSGAGQNISFLGLKNLDDIIDSIKKCWASLYSLRSVSYRKAHAQLILTEMAIVVQIMIPSDVSGVLFTKHTVSNKKLSVLITANYGLGESVVSGLIEPDTYIIKRNYNENDIEIDEIILGTKSQIIEIEPTGGTRIIENASSETQCLSNEHIIKLTRIGLMLEKIYCVPQDIEWAIYNDEIYLVQSRPITTLNKFTDWEYLHELDSPLMSPRIFLTRGNVGEVFTGVVDSLAQSTLLFQMDDGQNCYKTNFFDLLSNCGLIISHNYLFMNITAQFRGMFKKGKIRMSERLGAYGILGSLQIDKKMKRSCIALYGYLTVCQMLRLYSQLIKVLYNMTSNPKRLSNFIQIFKKCYADEKLDYYKNSTELYDKLSEMFNKHYAFVIQSHIDSSVANSVLQSTILMIIVDGCEELTSDHISDSMKIFNGGSEIISADIPRKVQEIANTIYLSGCSKQFLEIDSLIGIEWMKKNCKDAFNQYKQFIETYGHRCLNEFCYSSQPWEFHPDQVILMIQANLKVSNTAGREYEGTFSDVIDGLRTVEKPFTKYILRKLIPYCRNSVKSRESTKDSVIQFVHVARKHFIKLSELLVAEGVLQQKELIFFLTMPELETLVKKRQIYLSHKAFRRYQLKSEWEKLKFLDLITSTPKAVNDKVEYTFLDGEKKIKGLTVHRGCIEGRACVLNDISEVDKIESGDILITHSTDIAWSPYFPLLKGLVTELGGLISHGAVVAREYRLPCIVGAQNATSLLRFGDKILLNANDGYVTKLINKQ